MPIKEIEVYHGAVLAKIMRSNKPTSLRMIETNVKGDRSTYILNNEVNLFVSHSMSAKGSSHTNGSSTWTFTFSNNQLRQMNGRLQKRPVFVALVCGKPCTVETNEELWVCLLKPDEIAKLIEFSANQQSLTVCKQHGMQFRVLKNRQVALKVPESRLDKWEVPGS